jgi:phosphoribosylanthranilate isomerase
VTGRPRVKVCGITRAEDAALAVHLGADAVGFVLWDRSPRYIRPAAAAAIGRAVPPFVARVGVVVNMPAADIAPLMSAAGLDAIQLHGDEMMDDYAGVGARVIKAVALEADADVARAMTWPAEVTILVDAADRARRGGTGQRADWTRAAALARHRPVILAGGLTAENVAEAVGLVQPWAVDVSSGVEDAPGVKSARRMEEFFAALDRG